MKIDNKKFYSIYILNIINGLSFSLLIPVYPLLIKQYNEPEIVLGIFTAIFSFFQMFGTTIMGSLSDKYGRRPVLMVTQAGTFLSWLIIAGAYFIPDNSFFGIVSLPILAIFLSRAIDGVTGGNESVANAYISDLSTKEERTVVFGYMSAIFGITLIIGTGLGAFSMASSYGYLGTALLGAFFSFLALIFIGFNLKESLNDEDRKKELVLKFKELNIISQVSKWYKKDLYKGLILLKIFVFTVFAMHVTTFSLYIIDIFNFDAINIGYYLSFTGLFIAFNQAYLLKKFVAKFGDYKTLLIGLILVPIGFLLMYLSKSNIYLFTAVYFLLNLGLTLIMTIIQSLLSKNADKSEQGEIMGLSSSLSAFIFIYGPIMGGFTYGLNHQLFYLILAILISFSILIYIKYLNRYQFKII